MKTHYKINLTATQVLDLVNQYDNNNDEMDKLLDAFDYFAKKRPDARIIIKIPNETISWNVKNIISYEDGDGNFVIEEE